MSLYTKIFERGGYLTLTSKAAETLADIEH